MVTATATSPRLSPQKRKPTERSDAAVIGRAAKRCMKCGGPPFVLQKDCPIHSRKATAGRKAKKGAGIRSPIPGIATPPSSPLLAPEVSLLDQEGAPQPVEGNDTLAGASFLNPSNIDPSLRQLPPVPLHDPESPLKDTDQQGSPASPPSSLVVPSTPQSRGGSNTSSPSPSSRIRFARTFLDGQRQHPTREKPAFGFMKAKRGRQNYEVVRTGSLIGQVARKKVNRHFTRKMDRILLACERVADETDCWLYVAAHHPSVQGEYTHWVSPQMQRDLPRAPLSFLEETSGNLFNAMKTARRQDVATVELQAAKLRAERDAARNANAQIQDVVEKLASRLRASGEDVDDLMGGLAGASGST